MQSVSLFPLDHSRLNILTKTQRRDQITSMSKCYVFSTNACLQCFSHTVHPPWSVGSQNVCQMFTFLGWDACILGQTNSVSLAGQGCSLQSRQSWRRGKGGELRNVSFTVPLERGPAVRPAAPPPLHRPLPSVKSFWSLPMVGTLTEPGG